MPKPRSVPGYPVRASSEKVSSQDRLSSELEQKTWDRSPVMVAALIIRTSLEGGILLYELNGHPGDAADTLFRLAPVVL